MTSHTELDLLSYKEKYYMLLKRTLTNVISFLLLEDFCERGLKKILFEFWQTSSEEPIYIRNGVEKEKLMKNE